MNEVIIWTGWIGGIAVGLYALAQFWLTNRQLGCSLAYGNVIGFTSRLRYFHQGDFAQLNNWRLWFIVGIPLGGFLAGVTSPGFEVGLKWSMGDVYDRVMPGNHWLKGLVVMSGGVLMGYGARLAGGCTSGHVIAGCALLNPPSLLAGGLFFVGGLSTVQLLFGQFG